jgi:hypothetical protein
VSGDFSLKQINSTNDGITSQSTYARNNFKNQETILKMSLKKMVIRQNYSKKPVVRKRKVVLKVEPYYYSSWCIKAIGLAPQVGQDVDFLSVVGLGFINCFNICCILKE